MNNAVELMHRRVTNYSQKLKKKKTNIYYLTVSVCQEPGME